MTNTKISQVVVFIQGNSNNSNITNMISIKLTITIQQITTNMINTLNNNNSLVRINMELSMINMGGMDNNNKIRISNSNKCTLLKQI